MAKKELVADVEAADMDHADMRVYELGFHLDPELSDSDAKAAYQGIRSACASVGTIVAEGEPQKIQLAYTVSRTETGRRRDFDASYFAWIAYETDGAGHEKVAETVRSENSVFRFLDIRTTKDEALHAAEMHEIMLKTSTEEPVEEVSDAEIEAAIKEVA